MVTLLYGDDQVSLQEHLGKLKEDYRNWEVLYFDLGQAKEEEIKQALNSNPLIAYGRLIILENWFSKKSKNLDLSQVGENVNVILIERSRVSPSKVKNLPKETKVFFFREDPIVFRFLDSLFTGNKRKAFYLYSLTLTKRVDPVMLYYLLISHLRRVLIAKESNATGLAQFENLASWQIEKYRSLAAHFDKERLVACYGRLLDFEQALKTGSDLTSLFPFLILELTQNRNPV